MAQSFQDYVTKERERLNSEREGILVKRAELDAQLAVINREFKAIEAYEAAKSGKTSRQSGPRTTGSRKGSKRDGIMAALADIPHGLTRGELLEKLGLKGNKSGEMSVSNALTALTKAGQVVRNDAKKYIASVG
jgi:DNA-binding transcriptional ArsR family regulator